jgi:hypothetical protein
MFGTLNSRVAVADDQPEHCRYRRWCPHVRRSHGLTSLSAFSVSVQIGQFEPHNCLPHPHNSCCSGEGIMIQCAWLIAVAGVATCLAGCCYIGIVLMIAIIGRSHQALHVDRAHTAEFAAPYPH